ncbi:uncharacterized protein I206_106147 [Kwoniella pini CBS 10737]|uniref:Uncharacterized protein n=1 Tax=Kwoniella pini CBS 10737 TaxID=1296096 RepID=A0A1B9I168_9TREE|nr:uncharacterized protein I206_04972 [Kwoniella pini CBS 10737]OCF49283.1 hypothetical protein I206_04972 [Kwoniella pini CBS 10737]
MAPFTPPTPSTPSNALVLRRGAGPISSISQPPITPSTPKRAPRRHVVKHEFIEPALPSTPRRIMAPPTPPSTGLIRRSRTSTPSPRRRRSYTAPSPHRPRPPPISSSANFRAKLAEIRARAPRRASNGSGTLSNQNSSRRSSRGQATVEDDDDDEEVQFWRSGGRRGSTVDVAIEVDESDDDSPPSPTPSSITIRRDQSVIPVDRELSVTPSIGNSNDDHREGRADSTFSLSSFGSRATPFVRAPTWDDSDPRYGKYYPRADALNKDTNNTINNTIVNTSPVPLAFLQSIIRVSETITASQPKVKGETKKFDDNVFSDIDKLNIVQSAIFPNGTTKEHQDFINKIKVDLESSQIEISIEAISNLISIFRISFNQSIKSHLQDYKTSTNSRGSKEFRQNIWFNEFRTFLKYSKSTLPIEIDKNSAENILLTYRVICYESNEMKRIVDVLNEKFQDFNVARARKLLDTMIDLFAQAINIAWSK